MKVPPDQMETWKHDKQGAIVGDVLAKKLGWKVGDKIILQSGIYPGDWQFTVDAIYQATSQVGRPLHVRLPLGLPERLDARPSAATRSAGSSAASTIPATSPTSASALDKRFEDLDTPTLSQDERSFNASFLAMFSAVLKAMNIISLVILVIMTLILGNTIAMGVRERTSEYGVLRAIGFLPGHVALWIVGRVARDGAPGRPASVSPWRGRSSTTASGASSRRTWASFFPYFRLETGGDGAGPARRRRSGRSPARCFRRGSASRLNVVDAVRRVA